jgi:hypothetical protein
MQPGFVALKQDMLTQPGVINITAAYEEPVDIGWGDGISKNASDEEE